jgi:hypothetical protein
VGHEADVKAREGKTRATFPQIKNIWNSKELTLLTKIKSYNSNINSVLNLVET